jgi:carbon-monoxide dehydrogenase medium subunit
MAAYWNRYYTPNSVEEALALLAEYDGRARVVGGGTDLLLQLQQGLCPRVEALVDVTRIEGMNRIDCDGDFIVIGCGVTHAQIVKEERIIRRGTCLVESCGVIGGPQVRNVGTLAGNVAHALPAGDGTIGLLALDGEIEIAGAEGTRWAPMTDGFAGPGESAIDHNRAVLSRLRFRGTGAGEGSAFRRVMRPQGIALPILAMAARVRIGEDGRIRSARIGIGPAGPTPFLATDAMAQLEGVIAGAEAFAAAAETALAQSRLRTSKHRASEPYRARMIRSQLPLTLTLAAQRARTGDAVPEGVGR